MKRCNNIWTSLLSIVTIMISVSCSKEFPFGFKELCFYHPHTAPIQVNVDWSNFNHIEKPTGMTVYVWPQNEGEEPSNYVTHHLSEVKLDMKAGHFHSFVYNQSATEYATIDFCNLDQFDKAEVKVKQVKSSWYSTKLPETRVGSEPEWLAIDCIQNIEVTDEMVEVAEAEFIAGLKDAEQKKARTMTKTVNDLATLTPKSIIKNLDIYVHIENIPFLRSALGALEGMAEGCYISTIETTSGHITHTLEDWGLIYERDENGAEDLTKGMLKATISTFGVPSDHTGKPEDNNLYIKLLLVDNVTILPLDFPIGDQLAKMNEFDGTELDENGEPIWPEIHVYWPEPLPEVEPLGGSDGAFDVGVSDWGEEIVTILPLL